MHRKKSVRRKIFFKHTGTATLKFDAMAIFRNEKLSKPKQNIGKEEVKNE